MSYLPSSENQDYNPFAKNKAHTKRVWCPFCFGTGYYRARSHSLDPRISIKLCQHCKGKRRVWVTPGSDLDKQASKVVPGLWPNKSTKVSRK